MTIQIVFPVYSVQIRDITLEVDDCDPSRLDNDFELKLKLLKAHFPKSEILPPEMILRKTHEDKREAFKIIKLS